VTDLRRRTIQNLKNIKTERDVGHIEHAQPGHRSAEEQTAFLLIHGCGRTAKGLAAPGFHFDKNQDLAIPADNVNFPSMQSPEIPAQNLPSLLLEKNRSPIFTDSSEREMPGFRRGRASSSPREQTSDDGSDWDHVRRA
jgi:hypothetical protein